MHSVRFPGGSTWQLNQGYGHGERIFDIAFHPISEDVVLTASEDSSVRMWRRPDGSAVYKQVRAFLGHKAEALRACWSANGFLLASGSADSTVRLWAADLNDQGYTGRQLALLDGHPEEVYHVEFVDPAAPPLTVAAAVRQHAAFSSGNAESAGPPPPLPPFETHVMVASCESLFVWSLQEGAVVQQADAPGTTGSTITQDAILSGARPAYIFGVSRQPAGGPGSLVAAACCDGVVRLWSLRPTGHLEWAGQLALPGQPMLTGCAFSEGGSLLGVCSREGRLMELDVRMLELTSSRPLPASPVAVTYLPPPSRGGAALRPNDQHNQQQQQQQQQQKQQQQRQQEEGGPMWLVACRDGAVYGYEPGHQQGGGGGGDGGCWVLRPPSGPGVTVLALAVGPGARAVALGGEPQDVALLPPIQPQTAATALPSLPAATVPPQSPAAASGDSGGDSSALSVPNGQTRPGLQLSAAAQAGGRVAMAAPLRRRGGGAGRVVIGNMPAARDPLALLDSDDGNGGGISMSATSTISTNQTVGGATSGSTDGTIVDGGGSADVVAGDLAAMWLERRQPTASGASVAQQYQQLLQSINQAPASQLPRDGGSLGGGDSDTRADDGLMGLPGGSHRWEDQQQQQKHYHHQDAMMAEGEDDRSDVGPGLVARTTAPGGVVAPRAAVSHGQGMAAFSGRIRAPLLVYRRVT